MEDEERRCSVCNAILDETEFGVCDLCKSSMLQDSDGIDLGLF